MTSHKYEQPNRPDAPARARAVARAVRRDGLRESAQLAATTGRDFALVHMRRAWWRAQAVILERTTSPTFTFLGEHYRYFWHHYNATWRNERSVEVPIATRAIEGVDPARVLEIGNVLSHYRAVRHRVVDKFERGQGVLTTDLLDYRPDERYDAIVSISTLEHVGYDDDPREPARVEKAIAHIRSLLSDQGRALVTIPMGYNRYLDDLIVDGRSGFDELHFIARHGRRSWTEATLDEVMSLRYGAPYPGANGLVVAYLAARTRAAG